MPKEKIIIVSGFAGSGKSTLAEKLAKHFGMKCIHASDLLRQLQDKKASELRPEESKAGSGWWETKEGKEFMKKRLEDMSMDRELDKLLLKVIDEGNVVVDSWTMPWLSKKGFKIWLDVSAEERAKRVAKRDCLDVKDVIERIEYRDVKTAEIYRNLYGFELGKDLKPFNLVARAEKTEEGVFEEAKKALERYFKA